MGEQREVEEERQRVELEERLTTRRRSTDADTVKIGHPTFLVSVDDFGYFYVNGKNLGYFPWDGEFVLTENAKPGDKFLIAVKVINTGGPLRLLRARIDMEGTKELRQTILDFSLSMKVGQKLLSFDTYQTNARVKTDPGIDKSKLKREERLKLNEPLQQLAMEVDVDALGKGEIDKFKSSMDKVRSHLGPIKEFVKKFTLYFDSRRPHAGRDSLLAGPHAGEVHTFGRLRSGQVFPLGV